ncbi:16754_t:CDS:1, partial [Rhizophagus irregularis]
NSKESMGIVERFNCTLQEWVFFIQDSVEMRLPSTKHCRAWVKNLPIFLVELDNSVTRLLGISPAKARKKEHVFAKTSKPQERPIG